MNKRANISTEQEQNAAEGVKADKRTFPDNVFSSSLNINVYYLTFLAFICILYIANNRHVVETQRALNNYTDTLKELRWEYMDAKKQMIYAQTETEVIKSATAIGLKPMTLPAFTIQKDTTTRKPANAQR